MKRKDFVKSSMIMGAGMGFSPSLACNSLAEKKLNAIGLGLFSIPKIMEQDLEGTIKKMAAIGIKEFETYGPYSFTHQKTKASWAEVSALLGFSASGFFGRSAQEFKDLTSQYGISVPAMHTDLYTLESYMPSLAKAARSIGATYVVLPSIPEPERLDIKAYHLMASRFNEIGRIAKEEGIRFAYHNHGYGLIPEDNGIVPLDIIFEETDSDKVFFEMDLFWTVAGKADPIDLLKKYKGRYKMLHIKDMKSITYFKGKGSTSSEWMELFPQLVPAGSGEIPLQEIMDVAYHNGVLHYFVEHDLAPNPYENIQSAFNFLNGLRF